MIQTFQNPQTGMTDPFVLLTGLLLEGQQPAEVAEGQPRDEVSRISRQQRRTLRSCYRPPPVQQLQDVHSGCK